MVEGETPAKEPSDGGPYRRATPPEPRSPDAFERAKRALVLACAGIAGGLAIAGTLDPRTGGVLLLAGWLGAVASLHRLGRAGSQRRPAD